MITGALKSKVDNIWNTMWSGGISNPLSVIEQLTYLLFIKRLDELQTLKERKAARTSTPIQEPVFGAGQARLRWRRSVWKSCLSSSGPNRSGQSRVPRPIICQNLIFERTTARRC